MAATPDQFLERLFASGLMSPDEVERFCAGVYPPRDFATGEALAREFVRTGKLTRYQAAAILQGRIRGLRFGEYVVLEKIGRGGMGVVFKARHRRMKRDVALKVLPPASLENEAAVQRFYREVEAVARLIHPNIVIAYDAGEHDRMHYLVMEYVAGQNLATLLHEKGPLPVPQAIDYVVQAARGLQYAHEHGVVHRDIKPGNLLLSNDGVVKVLDLGLARMREEQRPHDESGETLTMAGQVMGTVDYMSPEQAADTHHADARSDIYSLGCTLYRLLTDQCPFKGDTVLQKLVGHLEKPAPSLRVPRPDVPERLDAAYRRMLTKDPADRQQSMTEVIAELEAVFDSPNKGRTSGGGLSAASEETVCDPALSAFLTQMSSSAVAAPPAVQGATEETIDLKRSESDTDEKAAEPPVAAAPGAFAISAPTTRPAAGSLAPASRRHAARGKNARLPVAASVGMGVVGLALVGLIAAVLIGRSNDDALTADANGNSKVRGNYALTFDGQTSYVEIPTLRLDPAQPFTVEARVYPMGEKGARRVLLGATHVPWLEVHHHESGGLALTTYTAEGWREYLDSSSAFTGDGRSGFRNVAVVWDGAAARLFVEGKRLASSNTTGKNPNAAQANAAQANAAQANAAQANAAPATLLGAAHDFSNGRPWRFFHGGMDEIRISQIARYDEDYLPSDRLEADLDTLALYHCDEGGGKTLIDASGKNHHGRVVGVNWVRTRAAQSEAPAMYDLGIPSFPAPVAGVKEFFLRGRVRGVGFTSLAWSTRGAWIAAGIGAGQPHPYRLAVFDPTWSNPAQLLNAGTPYGLTWSPDGQAFAGVGPDLSIGIWDSRGVLKTQLWHPQPDRKVNPLPPAWMLDSATVATAGHGNSMVQIWAVEPPEVQATIDASPYTFDSNWPQTLAASPIQALLAFPSAAPAVVVWNRERQKVLIEAPTTAPVLALAWSPTEPKLAVSTATTLRILDIPSGEETHSWPDAGARYLAWSPDGSRLALAPADGSPAKVYDVQTRAPLPDGPPRQAVFGYRSLNWSNDGQLLCDLDERGRARYYDVATGAVLATLVAFNNGEVLAFNAQGHVAAPPNVDLEKLIVYDVTTEGGERLLLKPSEFAQRFEWKTDPSLVRFGR